MSFPRKAEFEKLDHKKINLLVGFEVHQQLKTGRKLFCDCPPGQIKAPASSFARRLRPTQSELGEVDPAAMFEFLRGKVYKYVFDKEHSCLVEADEEPPHPISKEAVLAAVVMACALNSKVVDEIHVMRKLVIDGSNTGGFQRTALIAVSGVLKCKNLTVPIQTICLEEDACRLIEEEEKVRTFALDRLGTPLVEIASAPLNVAPHEIEDALLTLGRLLRMSGLVARGLGTLRQDLNISVMGGPPAEVKGIQRLELVSKVIEFEARRQMHLVRVAEMLREKGLSPNDARGPFKVTELFSCTESKLIKNAIERGEDVYAIVLRGLKELLKEEPYPGVRLGIELAEAAQAYEVGGILHSDELPSYGITANEVSRVKEQLGLGDNDAFLILTSKDPTPVLAVLERARAIYIGVPYETRSPTPDGRTRYSRPRPGSARLYPETDIPLMKIEDELIEEARKRVPKPWEHAVNELLKKYGISAKLAAQVMDSPYEELFEEIVSTKRVPPSVVATILTETLVSISREGYDVSVIEDDQLRDLFGKLDEKRISKEAVPDVLRLLCSGEAKTVSEAIEKLGLKPVAPEELEQMLREIVERKIGLVMQAREGAFSPLMGEAMSVLRGRIDGALVATVLRKVIEEKLKGK